MANMSGKFTTTPSPKVEVGQFWRGRNGVVRRVVEPLDEWEVSFSNVVTGYRTRVQRVSRNGSPAGGYEFVPPPEHQVEPMHVRMGLGGEAGSTYCGAKAAERITTTLSNLKWWKARKREICSTCDKRVSDRVHVLLEQADVAA
jgi:hypothetical protein